eukprot:CAMPEP_0204426132 /NCGR_PEP_ID=MMETSP0470-20130426/51396_1 /ASSEMBLY_ACC=CAM_ASM_000385 /TAXON_ID=2969 /ORGANISM="Oxyrrhis marina" /LENGTH=90 /DNA_ID=CAMNT_0051423815 /DNA_START=333 /DNA_END=602 /DNA_ORIENTATION=+
MSGCTSMCESVAIWMPPALSPSSRGDTTGGVVTAVGAVTAGAAGSTGAGTAGTLGPLVASASAPTVCTPVLLNSRKLDSPASSSTGPSVP